MRGLGLVRLPTARPFQACEAVMWPANGTRWMYTYVYMIVEMCNS